MVVAIALLVLTGRGGFGLRPTGIIEASKYSKGENTAFVLPTAFTMLKTISQSSLVQVEYFSEKEVSKYFNPIKTSNPQNILPDNTNVMVIMLESFGKEFIGAYNNGKGYTPFLDSLIEENGIDIILPLLKEIFNTLFETFVVPTENGFIV